MVEQEEEMKVFVLKDHTGAESTHLAADLEAAIQAHLVHFGLPHLNGEIEVISVRDLKEIKDRGSICWKFYCCIAGATIHQPYYAHVSRLKAFVNTVKKENNHE